MAAPRQFGPHRDVTEAPHGLLVVRVGGSGHALFQASHDARHTASNSDAVLTSRLHGTELHLLERVAKNTRVGTLVQDQGAEGVIYAAMPSLDLILQAFQLVAANLLVVLDEQVGVAALVR